MNAVQSTTGVIAALVLTAAIAPAASPHGKKIASSQSAAALVMRGRTLFLTNCSPCHGADAGGDDGPNLHQKNLTDVFIAAAIQNGFQNEMPPFGSKLKAPEVNALVAYVHSLQKPRQAASHTP